MNLNDMICLFTISGIRKEDGIPNNLLDLVECLHLIQLLSQLLPPQLASMKALEDLSLLLHWFSLVLYVLSSYSNQSIYVDFMKGFIFSLLSYNKDSAMHL